MGRTRAESAQTEEVFRGSRIMSVFIEVFLASCEKEEELLLSLVCQSLTAPRYSVYNNFYEVGLLEFRL